MSDAEFLSPIEEIIADAAAGRFVVLVDDENRENEGDLIIPAAFATAEAVNFMARYGRGLICLALTHNRVEELGLPLMAQQNGTRHQTAFTVSIEAREGVTTGISAADRARTIQVAVDPARGRSDIVTPGHVFPLVAREGGVLVRAGHTEATVDIARLAGTSPAGVLCEIMNDDGTMARLPDLVKFAQFHGLKLGSIADLIAYRRRRTKLVQRELETEFSSVNGGAFKVIVFVNEITKTEHLALIKGDLTTPEPVLVRVHAVHIMNDILSDVRAPARMAELQESMRMIGEAGRGAVVLIREASVAEALKGAVSGVVGGPELRHYGVGAQILVDLGIKDMVLLSNSQRAVVGLEGYGLTIVERRLIPIE